MPGTFITAILFSILAVLCGGYALLTRGQARAGRSSGVAIGYPVGIAVLLAVFAAIFVLLASWNPVGTQDIGIVTSFGQPVGHLSPGANFTAPWDQVTPMDEAIQVTDYEGPNCVQIRIADQQTACADAAIRWRINPAAADSLFRNYKNSTAGVTNGLITPELDNTANLVFADYDPVGLLNSPVPPGQPGNPTVPQLAQQVQAQLTSKVGSDVTIISLFIPKITYDQTVQARLNAVLAQKADTLVAQQAEQTATDQAAANRALAGSVSNDPMVLVSRCLDYLETLAKQGLVPPAGFSCWPGTGSGVVIPASK
jgi:regulator of protease activity HflC (stomatin/prohibitin superfamily)